MKFENLDHQLFMIKLNQIEIILGIKKSASDKETSVGKTFAELLLNPNISIDKYIVEDDKSPPTLSLFNVIKKHFA